MAIGGIGPSGGADTIRFGSSINTDQLANRVTRKPDDDDDQRTTAQPAVGTPSATTAKAGPKTRGGQVDIFA